MRTLRKAVTPKAAFAAFAAFASLNALRQPRFTAIGDPEKPFPPIVLRDMLDLTCQLAT